MLSTSGSKLLALSIIVQALRDLHQKGERPKHKKIRESANEFFNSEMGELCREIIGVKTLDEVYEKFGKERLYIQKHIKYRQKEYIETSKREGKK